jgi:cell division septal protein FtsQ
MKLFNKTAGFILNKENRLYLYLILIISFTALLSVSAAKWKSSQIIKQIIISGNTYIPTEEILSKIDKTLINKLHEDIQLINLKKNIIVHEFISNTYLMQRNPSIIEIEVEERIPIAIVTKPDGSLCYLDKTGYLLPYRLSLKFDELPIIRNLYINSKIDSTALLNTANILTELKKEKNELLFNLISEIVYLHTDKSFEIITTDKAYKILFGRAIDVSKKIEKCCEFLATKMNEINVNDMKYIDIRWKNRVIIMNNEV